jgi:hypothetical protein
MRSYSGSQTKRTANVVSGDSLTRLSTRSFAWRYHVSGDPELTFCRGWRLGHVGYTCPDGLPEPVP